MVLLAGDVVGAIPGGVAGVRPGFPCKIAKFNYFLKNDSVRYSLLLLYYIFSKSLGKIRGNYCLKCGDREITRISGDSRTIWENWNVCITVSYSHLKLPNERIVLTAAVSFTQKISKIGTGNTFRTIAVRNNSGSNAKY